MPSYIIVELDDGLAVVELPPGTAAEEAAAAEGGVLIDAGPFDTAEEANDAIDNLEAEEDDNRS